MTSEGGGEEEVLVEECSLTRFCRFIWPMNFGLACSMESFKLAETIDSLRLGSGSILSSAVSLSDVRDFEKLSEVISCGGTLGLG